MKRIVQNFSILLVFIIGIFTAGCKETHDATVNFEFDLSDAVAKVANLYVVTSVKDKTEIFSESKSFSKIFSGSMDKDQSDNFLMIAVFLTLKDNYQEEIKK